MSGLQSIGGFCFLRCAFVYFLQWVYTIFIIRNNNKLYNSVNHPGRAKCVLDSELWGASVFPWPAYLPSSCWHRIISRRVQMEDQLWRFYSDGLMRTDGKHPSPVWVPPCREDVNQLEDTRMWGVSPKIVGRFIIEKCIHRWQWGVMVPCLHISDGCPGQRGLLCSVSLWDGLLLRMMTNQSSPLGEAMWRQIIYLFFKPEKNRVFSLFIPALYLSPEAFKIVYMEQYIDNKNEI